MHAASAPRNLDEPVRMGYTNTNSQDTIQLPTCKLQKTKAQRKPKNTKVSLTLQFVSFTACTLRNGINSTPNVLAQAGLTFPRSPTHTFTRQKRCVSRNFYVSNPIPDAAAPMRPANIELQNPRRHRIIRYTQTKSNLDAAVPTQKQLYTCKTSNSISTKKQKSP